MKKVIAVIVCLALFVSACSLFNNSKVAECEELSTETLQNTCYAELGILRGNLNLCDQATTEESKFYCYEGIAADTNAPAICDDITNSCYRDVGINLVQTDLCVKSENMNLKNECLYNVSVSTQTTSACSLISDEPTFVRCFTGIAIEQKSIIPCKEMNAPALTHDRCVFEVAKPQKDPSTCNHLLLSTTKQICFERVKEIAAPAKNQTNSTLN